MKTEKLKAFGMGALFLASVLSGSVCAAEKVSQEKIVEAAKMKAVERGYNVDAMKIIYDEDNKMFQRHLRRKGVSRYHKETNEWQPVSGTTPEQDRPKLTGRDYQAVYFAPKQARKGGDLWVFVDRNTGEVLDAVGGK